MSKRSATPARIAATPRGVREGFGSPNYPRHLGWGATGLFGGGGYMREMGAICQIGILTWKPCTFWVQNGFIFGLFALSFQ